jgi:hypothetical protein
MWGSEYITKNAIDRGERNRKLELFVDGRGAPLAVFLNRE